jgi:two-component system alkaline phosphatase synthesis response regulator PhoP
VSQQKVLIIEDEINIYELIKFNLEKQEFIVEGLHEGVKVLEKINEFNPNLIILDLMLPGKDGLSICREIRQSKEFGNIPIIMLTAKSDEFDKVLGLEMGADDYITKPFSIKELYARVKAVLRRYNETRLDNIDSESKVIEFENIKIFPDSFEVYKNNDRINLTLKEYELLLLLVKNKSRVMSRNELLDKIWGYNYFGETRTVDVHIRHLRKKIEENDSQPKYIETVRGVGYRFNG